jgi:hypothetical protein
MNIQLLKILVMVLFSIFAIGGAGIAQVIKPTDKKILFEGKVSKVGEKNELMSGVFASYQLMEYNVIKVVKGNYADNKIIVDHLVLSGKELNGVKLGSKVCIEVTKIKNLPDRMDDNIVRRSEDKVDWFYLGRLYRPYKNSPCRIDL